LLAENRCIREAEMSTSNPLRDPGIRTIGDLFIRNADQFGQEIGVVAGEHRFTWGEVNNRVNRLANGLLEQGLRKGDRVAVLNLNNHLWPEAHGGVAKAGGITVPVNFRLAPSELETVLKDSGTRFLIIEETFVTRFQQIRSQCPDVRDIICYGGNEKEFLDYDHLLSSSSDREPPSQREVREDDVHLISYTGGTTGTPKGTMWLHQRTLDIIYLVPFPFELICRGRVLIHFPTFAAGVTGLMLCGIYGASYIVFMDFDPTKALETIERERIELLPAVPTVLQLLINAGRERPYDLSSLKRIYYGAMPISVSLLKDAMAFFGCELVQAYGMTENTGLTMTQLEPHDHVLEGPPKKLERLSSAGRAIRGVDLRIVDEEDKELPRGETGEIVFKSLGLMAGYWNKPEETKRAMKGGWFHPGDIGWIDEEGYLFIVDRKHDMIISGGYNVYPSEVEEVISRHKDVLETTVFGTTDPTWGERVVAVVRVEEGRKQSEEEIREFCRKHLAGYKVPKEVRFVEEPLPRNHYGKILRREVKKNYQQGMVITPTSK
jgi:long-chain acyl-CoA synthetase